jgi:chemotaxis protein MotB
MAERDLSAFLSEEEDTGDASEWMNTFCDLALLLLTFFILLYSLSTPDPVKLSDTLMSVSHALQGQAEKVATSKITSKEAGVLMDQVMMKKSIIESQKKLFSDVQYFQTTKGLEGIVGAYFQDGLITLRAPGDVLFTPGEAELTPRGLQAVAALKDFFIKHVDQTINIKGFSDTDPPPAGSRFKDNWEVSAMRAVNVLRALIKMGLNPNRMTATGLADLEPLFPNNTPENKARNRRVEFVLERRVIGGGK